MLAPLFYCLLGFTLIFVINDLFDNFSDFLSSGIKPLEILYYYSLILPPVMVLILPPCLLLAMLYSLARLTRYSEITAMRAGGVSIYRILIPFIGVGILSTLTAGFINEVIAPNAAFRAEQFLEYQQQGRMEDIYYASNIALKNNDHVWMIHKFDTRDQSMYNVEFTQPDPNGGEIKMQADKALWLDGRWWFMDITVQRYNENGDLAGAPEMILQKEMRDLKETPETFMSEIKDPQYLSSREMLSFLQSKKGLSDSTRARLEVDLHSRIATPLVCLVVTMIGIPVGAHTGRKGAFAGIMVAMSLFFVFYILQLITQGLGKQEIIPAWLGAWFPIILFSAVSPFLIHRMR